MTGSRQRKMISDMIESNISDSYPQMFDDDLVTVLSDGDIRSEAIDDLIRFIEANREDL